MWFLLSNLSMQRLHVRAVSRQPDLHARGMSLIFCTISLLSLRSVNRCSEILINYSCIYSPSVNCLPCLTISWVATKLHMKWNFADFIHFLIFFVLSSTFCISSEMTFFLFLLHLDIFQQMPGAYSENVLQLFDFSLFVHCSLHRKHTGKPASPEVKAYVSAHVALNLLFS